MRKAEYVEGIIATLTREMSRCMVVLVALAFVISCTSCGNDKNEYEKPDTSIEENAESGASADDKFPAVDFASAYLGCSYSTVKAQGTVKFEVPVSGEFLTHIHDTAEDGIDYRMIDEHIYVGTKEDTVVAFVRYGYPTEMYVNNWVKQEGFYDNPPRIMESGDMVLLGWKINGGYLIISAYPTGTDEWYKYRPNWIICVESLDQCHIEW